MSQSCDQCGLDWREDHSRCRIARQLERIADALTTLDAEDLAVAINDAQIRPDELLPGRDLLPPAQRILTALTRARGIA